MNKYLPWIKDQACRHTNKSTCDLCTKGKCKKDKVSASLPEDASSSESKEKDVASLGDVEDETLEDYWQASEDLKTEA